MENKDWYSIDWGYELERLEQLSTKPIQTITNIDIIEPAVSNVCETNQEITIKLARKKKWNIYVKNKIKK